MKKGALAAKMEGGRFPSLFAILLSGLLLVSYLFLPTSKVYAQTYTRTSTVTSCPDFAQPDSNSSLIILLDRSGSLGDGVTTQPTDQYKYSTSIAKALVDLWPGGVVVIPFGDPRANGANSDIPILPIYRADTTPGQRDVLKTEIQNYPTQGGTPVAPAMRKALALDDLQRPAVGSRIVLITDGGPSQTSPHVPEYLTETSGKQHDEILTNNYGESLVSQFRKTCVPFNIFGLKTVPVDNQFLQQVADDINGAGSDMYKSVQSEQQLAKEILFLYSNWRGLSFNQVAETTVSKDYRVVTDSTVSELTLITFHSANVADKPLTTRNGQAVNDQVFTDTHYQIDYLVNPSANTYITSTTATSTNSGDKDFVAVYSLLKSTRALQLIQPKLQQANTGQNIAISVQFIDQGQKPLIPAGISTGDVYAEISGTINGKNITAQRVDLKQKAGSPLFIGSYTFPSDQAPGPKPVFIGNLQIDVHGKYQDVIYNADKSIQLYVPQEPYSCRVNAFQCFIEEHPGSLSFIILGVILLLLLGLLGLALLAWNRQPTPFGWLVAPNQSTAIELGKDRSWRNKWFSKSVISTSELSQHHNAIGTLNLAGSPFRFVFKPDGKAYLQHTGVSSTSVGVRLPNQQTVTLGPTNRDVELPTRSTILVNNVPLGTFQTTAPAAQPFGGPGNQGLAFFS